MMLRKDVPTFPKKPVRSAYLKAARYVDQHGVMDSSPRWMPACDLLLDIDYSGKLADEFRSLFVEDENYLTMEDVCESTKEAKTVRTLALCLMAAIAEDEEKHK